MARIFLCHASEDKLRIEAIYQRLRALGWQPWMDKMDLLPGQRWQQAIPRALRASDFILIFFSRNSVTKRGYVQREFKLALDTLQEIPEDLIHTIPIRLDECDIPPEFGFLQWCNFFEEDGFERIVQAIRAGLLQRQRPESSMPIDDPVASETAVYEHSQSVKPAAQDQQAAEALTPAFQARKAASDVAHSEPGRNPKRLIYVLVVCSLAALIGISYWIIQPPIPLLPLSTPGLDTLPAQKAVLPPTPDDASQGPVADKQQPNIAPQHGLKMLNGEAMEDLASPATRVSEASEARVQGSSTDDQHTIVSVPESNEPSMASPIPAHNSNRHGKFDDWLFRSKGR